MDREDLSLVAIERAAERGWPALASRAIDGWLARASSGGSVRANSVSALDYTGRDLELSIAAVVAFYREEKARPRFTITDASAPAGLDDALAARGWRRQGEHVTMAKNVAPPVSTHKIEVRWHEAPTPGWFQVYLEGLSQDRRAVAPRLVERVPAPRMFFSALRDGNVIASGLSVLDGPLASVQCMATLPFARRTGTARAVLAAIEGWGCERGARRLYLQTDLGNSAAMALYQSVGYTIAGRYHTRELA